MLSDGNYTIDVTLEGGSGRSTVKSPTEIFVEDGRIQAEIEWSSPNYDYMEINGKEYYPINDSGNSRFLIDVASLDSDIPVSAETVAMSQPHLIDYTFYFDSSTAQKELNSNAVTFVSVIAVVLAVTAVSAILFRRKKSNDKK